MTAEYAALPLPVLGALALVGLWAIWDMTRVAKEVLIERLVRR